MVKFYAGQKVKIIDNTCGHNHEIGEVVTLVGADEYPSHWDLESVEWTFDEDDCEPYQEIV